jgi:hypothetical protein
MNALSIHAAPAQRMTQYCFTVELNKQILFILFENAKYRGFLQTIRAVSNIFDEYNFQTKGKQWSIILKCGNLL